MPEKNISISLICCLICFGISFSSEATEIYHMPTSKSIHCNSSNGNKECNMPQDSSFNIAKCTSKNNLVYCTDEKGQAITGEILKYKDGLVIRRYVMKDGYLDGEGKAYDEKGYLLSTLTYEKGILNGSVKNYDRTGVKSIIPYVNGKKEGIAEYKNKNTTVKSIYIDNDLNGETQVWDNQKETKIYDFEMSYGLVKNAIYYHYDDCTANPDKKEIIKQEKIDPLLIDALNLGCAKIRENISSATYPVVLKREEKCMAWFKENNQNLHDLKEKYECR